MIRPVRLALLALLLLPFAAACHSSPPVADLAENRLLCADVEFQTKAPGDRELFLAPLVDARDPTLLPQVDRGFPIVYGGDEFWDRPVPAMLQDLLTRELQESGLFARLVDQPGPETLILKPSLVLFTAASQEGVAGSRSVGEVLLRLQVLGPADGQGQRPVLLDQGYGNRQLSNQEMKPVSPYLLVGRALHASLQKALAGLDGSNLGRRHVPLDVAVPADAATRR